MKILVLSIVLLLLLASCGGPRTDDMVRGILDGNVTEFEYKGMTCLYVAGINYQQAGVTCNWNEWDGNNETCKE